MSCVTGSDVVFERKQGPSCRGSNASDRLEGAQRFGRGFANLDGAHETRKTRLVRQYLALSEGLARNWSEDLINDGRPGTASSETGKRRGKRVGPEWSPWRHVQRDQPAPRKMLELRSGSHLGPWAAEMPSPTAPDAGRTRIHKPRAKKPLIMPGEATGEILACMELTRRIKEASKTADDIHEDAVGCGGACVTMKPRVRPSSSPCLTGPSLKLQDFSPSSVRPTSSSRLQENTVVCKWPGGSVHPDSRQQAGTKRVSTAPEGCRYLLVESANGVIARLAKG
eukprot:gnl/TRDRNA2_/TRDRNA2_184096_c0_seq1.p1 gnl/TRDRNA2_/TRDRNA2_184096_c0~~gnl/TRDRNA2_/TRDRNA2_184096_c0_seq1.p1  ORF type:complete len:282 (-),score=15.79 gnl/TRDRNA2_/TRDRNA2_184096_c0_seq1:218-1063(-)